MTGDFASGQKRTWQTGTFAAIALGLSATSWIAANRPLAPHTRDVMTMALSFDLLVTLPGSYYLLVARPRGQQWWTVSGVAVLGMLRTAMLVVPAALARFILGATMEAGLLAVLVIRGRTAWRTRGRQDDPLLVMGRIMGDSYLPVVAEIVSSELAVFYYSVLCWWRRPHVAAGMRAFTVHQRGGVTAVLYVMAAMGLLETAVVHVVILHWSPRTAWTFTMFDLYGVLWLVAAARALVLRPILVDADTIVFRVSLWWTLAVNRRIVADVRPFTGPPIKRGSADPLSLAWFTTPTVLVHFHEPVIVTGMWGRKRTAAAIAVPVDDVNAFLRAVEKDGPTC